MLAETMSFVQCVNLWISNGYVTVSAELLNRYAERRHHHHVAKGLEYLFYLKHSLAIIQSLHQPLSLTHRGCSSQTTLTRSGLVTDRGEDALNR
jgi:hypothetical protein